MLVLARKVPPAIRERVLERPDVFGKLARLDDPMLDRVMAQLARLERKPTRPRGIQEVTARGRQRAEKVGDRA